MPDQIFYWYFLCPSGCSLWFEIEGRVLPADWETWRCRYCARPLRVFYPTAVTAEPPG